VIAEGDRVVTRSYWEGTHKGDFLGIPPTGKSVHVEGVNITRYSNGKAVEHWGYQDTPALMQQLGVNPMP
jgi:predicted ester cyclase